MIETINGLPVVIHNLNGRHLSFGESFVSDYLVPLSEPSALIFVNGFLEGATSAELPSSLFGISGYPKRYFRVTRFQEDERNIYLDGHNVGLCANMEYKSNESIVPDHVKNMGTLPIAFITYDVLNTPNDEVKKLSQIIFDSIKSFYENGTFINIPRKLMSSVPAEQALSEALIKRRNIAEEQRAKTQAEIDTALTSLSTLYGQLSEFDVLLKGIQSTVEEIDWDSTLKKCKEVQDVSEVFFVSDAFYVVVKNIIVEDADRRPRHIGDVMFSTNIKDGRVSAENLTYGNKYGRHHPHAHSDQETVMCLGDVNLTVPKLINEFRFVPLTKLIRNIGFSVVTSDVAGATIKDFPYYNEDGSITEA